MCIPRFDMDTDRQYTKSKFQDSYQRSIRHFIALGHILLSLQYDNDDKI